MEAVFFVLGCLLGLMIAALVAWWLINTKSKKWLLTFSNIESEKKQLSEKVYELVSQAASLRERAAQSSELKDELLLVRKAVEQEKNHNSELLAKLASLKAENEKTIEFFHQRISDLSSVHDHMREAFSSLSENALLKNADLLNSSFKQSLEHFFKVTEKDRSVSNENLQKITNPLKESLSLVNQKVQELENNRQAAYAGLKEQIEGLLLSQTILQKETHNLSRALNAPTIRGRWGEMQLRRVVELSGLSPHCDFVEQQSLSDGADVLRPDMIVTLPKNKKIIIDAKAPLEIFYGEDSSGVLAQEDRRGQELAASLKRHIIALKKKSYHNIVGQTPEFVVMFLPGEAFLHWAMLADPALLDYAMQNDIIIATPITLIALLKAIAFGFKQESIANNIEEVRRLSQQLIDRIDKVAWHFEKLGKSLKQATDSYNQTLSSLDSRVLVTARKLCEIKTLAGHNEVEAAQSLPFLESIPKEVSLKNQSGEPGDSN